MGKADAHVQARLRYVWAGQKGPICICTFFLFASQVFYLPVIPERMHLCMLLPVPIFMSLVLERCQG